MAVCYCCGEKLREHMCSYQGGNIQAKLLINTVRSPQKGHFIKLLVPGNTGLHFIYCNHEKYGYNLKIEPTSHTFLGHIYVIVNSMYDCVCKYDIS